MKLLLNILSKIALWIHGWSDTLCDWCDATYDKRYWYHDCARRSGRILWRAHDDFWTGKQPIFWD